MAEGVLRNAGRGTLMGKGTEVEGHEVLLGNKQCPGELEHPVGGRRPYTCCGTLGKNRIRSSRTEPKEFSFCSIGNSFVLF